MVQNRYLIVDLAFLTMRCLGDIMNKIIALLSVFLLLLAPLTRAETLYIIAHKGVFSTQKDKKEIADFYLLKLKINADGQNVIPINLPFNHPLRSKFSLSIFNRSPEALSEYWDRMSFRGVKPPVIQSSEQAVMLFVSRVNGAIGYVSKKPSEKLNIDVLGEIIL